MIVKLSKSEVKTMSSLDKTGKGTRQWMTARQVGAVYFRKKEDGLDQPEIREIRNAFRKLVREDLVEINADGRGQYRITDKGRKIAKSKTTQFESDIVRKTVGKKTAKKAASKKSAPKKAASKKVTKKAAPKRVAKKPPAKKAKARKVPTPPAKAKAKAESKEATKTETKTETKKSAGNGIRRPLKFKRRETTSYAQQTK